MRTRLAASPFLLLSLYDPSPQAVNQFFLDWGSIMQQKSKKLLDRVRDAIRLKHYAYSTEKTYVYWIKRFIFFHGLRHPEEMGDRRLRLSSPIWP